MAGYRHALLPEGDARLVVLGICGFSLSVAGRLLVEFADFDGGWDGRGVRASVWDLGRCVLFSFSWPFV